jgi:hypothetical protein
LEFSAARVVFCATLRAFPALGFGRLVAETISIPPYMESGGKFSKPPGLTKQRRATADAQTHILTKIRTFQGYSRTKPQQNPRSVRCLDQSPGNNGVSLINFMVLSASGWRPLTMAVTISGASQAKPNSL